MGVRGGSGCAEECKRAQLLAAVVPADGGLRMPCPTVCGVVTTLVVAAYAWGGASMRCTVCERAGGRAGRLMRCCVRVPAAWPRANRRLHGPWHIRAMRVAASITTACPCCCGCAVSKGDGS